MTSKLILGAAAAVLAASQSMALAQSPPAPTQQQQQPADPSPSTSPPTMTPQATPSVQPLQPGATSETKKVQQAASDWRSSKIVGITVYNTAGENIGEVDDLILSNDGRIQNAVLGVGGFLGMGEKLVSVPFSDLKMSRDDRGNVHLVLNSSRQSLQSAPEFRYHTDVTR